MKIRFAAGAIFSEIFTALGANPVQMSFADLQPRSPPARSTGRRTRSTCSWPSAWTRWRSAT
jgi:hypothetical protein